MTAGWHLVTLKPEDSCIPDMLSFNLLRAVLDFAVLCVTSSFADTPRQPPAEAAELDCRLQSLFSTGQTGKGPLFPSYWWSGQIVQQHY